MTYQLQSTLTSSCSFHDWYAAISAVHIPYHFHFSVLVSQRHHTGIAFHYKAITIPPEESKMPSNILAMDNENGKCGL